LEAKVVMGQLEEKNQVIKLNLLTGRLELELETARLQRFMLFNGTLSFPTLQDSS
jgi:hypothetical protein